MSARIFLYGLFLFAPSCASTFTKTDELSSVMSYSVSEKRLKLTAVVVNFSATPITFVRHPDFYYFSVQGVNAHENEALNLGCILYHRATKEDVVPVQPGGTVTFEREFRIKSMPNGVLEFYEQPEIGDSAAFMRVWDRELRATFSYGIHHESMPRFAWVLGRNYVAGPLSDALVFSANEVE